MKTVTTICDRCGCVVISDGGVLTAEAGDVRARIHTPLDLCGQCWRLLVEWLATPRAEAQP
jgi:hypothetical protein